MHNYTYQHSSISTGRSLWCTSLPGNPGQIWLIGKTPAGRALWVQPVVAGWPPGTQRWYAAVLQRRRSRCQLRWRWWGIWQRPGSLASVEDPQTWCSTKELCRLEPHCEPTDSRIRNVWQLLISYTYYTIKYLQLNANYCNCYISQIFKQQGLLSHFLPMYYL